MKIMLKSSDDAMLLKLEAMGDAAKFETKSKTVRNIVLILCAVIGVSAFLGGWSTSEFLGGLLILFLVDRYYQYKAKKKIKELN